MLLPLNQFGTIQEAGGPSWDAATLAEEVERRVAALSAGGIRVNDRVGILHGNSARFLADLLAVWHVGATASCLDDSQTAPELARVLKFMNAAALLVDRDPPASLADEIAIPVLKLADAAPARAESRPTGGLDDAALILFTSGTTGLPKAVVLSHRALLARVSLNAAVIGNEVLAGSLVTLPTHFGHGLIGNTLTPLMAGGRVVFHPPGLAAAHVLGDLVDEHGITFMSSVPTLWRMALKFSPAPRGSSLRRVHVGSAPLSAKLWADIVEWSGAEVVNCYGLTETANWVAGASSREEGIQEGLLGRPWGGSAAVLDEAGQIKHAGEGEVVLQSPSIMGGYLDRPDLTEHALLNGWYRTGDLGRVDEEGRIWMTGRLKDEINRGGFKVQPAEIDSLLETHPAVAEACTFGMSDALSGELVAVAVKLEPDAADNAETLGAWCRGLLRPAAVPEQWFFVDEIPRNARGKVSRDAVRKALIAEPRAANGRSADLNGAGSAPSLAASPAAGIDAAQIRSAVERAWKRSLGSRAFLDDEQFDTAGGDSLMAMHTWLMIEEALRIRLPMETFSASARPSELIRAIVKAVGEQASQDGARDLPLVFFFPPPTGDTPSYAEFRSEFAGKIRFAVVDYPSLREMVELGAGADAIIDAAVRQVLHKGEGQPLRLVGYSFGGCLAWSTAERLLERGHGIDFLGLVDTRPTNMRRPLSPQGHRLGRAATAVAAPFKAIRLLGSQQGRWDLAQSLLYAATRYRAFRLLRRLDEALALLPRRTAFRLRLRLAEQLRTIALKGVRDFKPLDLTATLFRSDSFPDAPDHLGWRPLCKNLQVVPVGGEHRSLEKAGERALICARFLETIKNTVGADDHTDFSGTAGTAPSDRPTLQAATGVPASS